MSTKRATKRALLTSILAICLCLVMLIGSTFAWFTDTASTSVNKIQSGTLKLALEMENGKNEDGSIKWVDAEGKTLDFKKAAGHENEAILWEPGCTYELPALRIRNDGNLALKYTVTVTGAEGDAELLDAIDFFVKKGEAAPVALADWDGILLPKGATADATSADAAKTDVEETTSILIYGKMKESAGNDCMDKTLSGIAITVNATQYTYEYDSKDNQYDKDAAMPQVTEVTPETVNTVFSSSGGNHVRNASGVYVLKAGTYNNFSAEFYGTEPVTLIASEGATFSGNIHVSYYSFSIKDGDQNYTAEHKGAFTVTGFNAPNSVLCVAGTVPSVTVKGNTVQSLRLETGSAASLTVADNVFSGNCVDGNNYNAYIVAKEGATGYSLTVTGNTFAGATSHALVVQSNDTSASAITVTGNTFNSYGDGKAAFKIWGDGKYAPSDLTSDELNADATALVESIKNGGNTFADAVKSNYLANFFGKNISFS